MGGDAALAATGIIWVRYSFVIKPVNLSLAAVSRVPLIGADSVLTRSVLWRLGEPLRRLHWYWPARSYC